MRTFLITILLLISTNLVFAQKVTIDTQDNIIKITPPDQIITLDDQQAIIDADKYKIDNLNFGIANLTAQLNDANDKLAKDQADLDSYKQAGITSASAQVTP